MLIEAIAYEAIDKQQGFGDTVDSDILNGIAYFQDQLKGIYFPPEYDGPVYRSNIIVDKVKPKFVELKTQINLKPVMEGVYPVLSVTLVTGKVLENGDIQWMVPITNGPIDDDEIFAAEEFISAKIDELKDKDNPDTKMLDELMYLQGFYEPHFRFSGLVREALHQLNQPLLVLDIDKSGNYEIKLTKIEYNTCHDCGITDETVKLDGDYYKCEDCIHFLRLLVWW